MDTALLGTPVELGQIGRELKKLWESTGGTQTRASLINFAVVCEGTEALEENTRLISDFTREHSCRALLLARDLGSSEKGVEAWINAHCHLPRAGAKHVCCEQITLHIKGDSEQLLLNTLFANLDSDLPLYLWWRGNLPHPGESHLWKWVNRFIFDSRDWRDPKGQLPEFQAALERSGSPVILCDLNWTRTLHLRQALAQLFDHPENLAEIPTIDRVRITHGPGSASTALLFLSWIAAQLGWTAGQRDGAGIVRYRGGEGTVECRLDEAPGAPISGVELASDGVTVSVQRKEGLAFYSGEVRVADGRTYQSLLPADQEDMGALLSEEITLGGRHRVYLKALQAAEAVL